MEKTAGSYKRKEWLVLVLSITTSLLIVISVFHLRSTAPAPPQQSLLGDSEESFAEIEHEASQFLATAEKLKNLVRSLSDNQ